MLNHITINNLAIVETLELELDNGFTVLTGETGAGKSILIDALGLILGDRADATAIRHDTERADIIAEFDISSLPAVANWMTEHDLDSDGDCIIRRSINAGGRSRGFINGRPIPLQVLRELGEKLVNIHGQNTHQALLRIDAQRNMLDAFAGLGEKVKELNKLYSRWKQCTVEFERLREDSKERDAKLELLQYQLQELDEFDLQINELESLEEEYQRLSNASRLIETAQAVRYQLVDNEKFSCAANLSTCISELSSVIVVDPKLQPVADLLNDAVIQVDEASGELRHYLDSLELDPERLNWVSERISTAHDLARKHKLDASELASFSDNMRAEIIKLENADNQLEELQSEVTRLTDAYHALARELGDERTKAGEIFAYQVEQHIHELGMNKCVFKPEIKPVDALQPQLNGMETIEFFVSTNPGQPLRQLSKVVSGGELSRISLAIQVVTAKFSDTPTLIFDEVDVGIGGGVAEMVGKKLRLLGNEAQILSVTHQPQVASQAHHHLNVMKQSAADKTTTSISKLSDEARIEEISRMLGGVTITDHTRSHAREMLEQALD